MKTFALFLCLIATTADAAPLYLKCEGKEYSRDPSDAHPVTYSIKIDGTNVAVEGGDPEPIYSTEGGDTWFFGGVTGRVYYATINRITGQVDITFSIKTKKYPTFRTSKASATRPKNSSKGEGRSENLHHRCQSRAGAYSGGTGVGSG